MSLASVSRPNGSVPSRLLALGDANRLDESEEYGSIGSSGAQIAMIASTTITNIPNDPAGSFFTPRQITEARLPRLRARGSSGTTVLTVATSELLIALPQLVRRRGFSSR